MMYLIEFVYMKLIWFNQFFIDYKGEKFGANKWYWRIDKNMPKNNWW